MQLCIVAHDTHFNQPANSQRDYSTKITHDKTSAMRSVHILCSNCPPPATTQARSLFCHSPTTLLMMHWSSLSYLSTMRSRSSQMSLILAILVACPRYCSSVSNYIVAVRKIRCKQSHIIFIKTDRQLVKLWKENKDIPILWNTVYIKPHPSLMTTVLVILTSVV